MSVSIGWIFFLAGLIGSAKVLSAKHLSEVTGYGKANENGSHTEVPMKLWVRILILVLNLCVAIGGAMAINHKHNWNPFAPCVNCKIDGGSVS